MNFKEISIMRIEDVIADLDKIKMPKGTREKIVTFMTEIGINSFRLGFQAGKHEMTEDEYKKILFVKNPNCEAARLINEITFAITD